MYQLTSNHIGGGRCVNYNLDNCTWNRIKFMNSTSTPSPWHPPIDISRNQENLLMDYLAQVEERIKHKIEQIEEEIDTTDQRQNTDRLIPKIETLNWVLNEILVLEKEDWIIITLGVPRIRKVYFVYWQLFLENGLIRAKVGKNLVNWSPKMIKMMLSLLMPKSHYEHPNFLLESISVRLWTSWIQ